MTRQTPRYTWAQRFSLELRYVLWFIHATPRGSAERIEMAACMRRNRQLIPRRQRRRNKRKK